MKWGKPPDYIYVLKVTNSTSYTRRLMAWLQEQNPELHKRMQAELAKLRAESRAPIERGEHQALWLKE